MALRNTPAWEALVAHQHGLNTTRLRDLFANDPQRAERLTTQVGDLTIDFSKHLVTDATLELLTQLAQATGFDDRREAMFTGARINTTEDRSVLHTALRANSPVIVDGEDVVPEVRAVLAKMELCRRCIDRDDDELVNYDDVYAQYAEDMENGCIHTHVYMYIYISRERKGDTC